MSVWLGVASGREEIPHVQGQKSPSKRVGGVTSRLESNPGSTRDAQRAQTNLVRTRTQGPHRDRDRTVFERLWWRYSLAVVCLRDRGSGCGYGIILLEEVAINPTLELPELT